MMLYLVPVEGSVSEEVKDTSGDNDREEFNDMD
jgi:hypothetical protein